MMTHYFFADDLLLDKQKENDRPEKIKIGLSQQKEIIREFSKKECGKRMMVIYVDIYGNEFKEVFKVK